MLSKEDAKILDGFVRRYWDLFEGYLEQKDIDPQEGEIIVEELETIANKEASDVE
jgi:hypothetical protein